MSRKKIIAVVLVLGVIGISWFTILKKATSKENIQNITAESGSQVVTNNYNITENDSSGISLNAEVEYTVNGSSRGDTTLVTGISYKF